MTPTIVLLLLKFTQEGGGRWRNIESGIFPLTIPRGPRTELVSKYSVLRLEITPPPREGEPSQPMDTG